MEEHGYNSEQGEDGEDGCCLMKSVMEALCDGDLSEAPIGR